MRAFLEFCLLRVGILLVQSIPNEPNPNMAGTFKFLITSNRMFVFETWPISMLAVISPKHCRGLPLAVYGTL